MPSIILNLVVYTAETPRTDHHLSFDVNRLSELLMCSMQDTGRVPEISWKLWKYNIAIYCKAFHIGKGDGGLELSIQTVKERAEEGRQKFQPPLDFEQENPG